MGLFSRGESQSRSEDSKPSHVTLGWFTRSTAEPSRQALSQLMKDFATNQPIEVVDRPPTAVARSRSSTVTTSSSSNTQYVGRPPSHATARPTTSQQQSFPQYTRPQTSAGSFLSKSSRILKRAGSKTTIRPETSGIHSRCSSDVSTTFMSGAIASAPSDHESARRPVRSARATTLSGPSDARHVNRLVGADTEYFTPITKAELEAKVEALATKRKTSDVTTTTPVTPLLTVINDVSITDERTSAPTTHSPKGISPIPSVQDIPAVNYLGPISQDGCRVSRFSWAPNYMLFSDVDFMRDADMPSSERAKELSAEQIQPQHDDMAVRCSDPVEIPYDSLLVPSEDAVVSSEISVLTSLAPESEPIVENPVDASIFVTESSDRGDAQFESVLDMEGESIFDVQSIRLSRAFPMPRSCKVQDSPDENFVFGDIRLQSIPNMFTSSTPPSPKKTKRLSIGFRDSDLCDWEEAIDYSWDHADEFDDEKFRPDDDGVIILQRPESQMVPMQYDMDMDNLSNTSGSSHTSTPALKQSSGSTTGDDNDSEIVSPRHLSNALMSSQSRSLEPMSPLLGLGLGAFEPTIPVRKPRAPAGRSGIFHQHQPSDIRVDGEPIWEELSTPLSKSSSQYSVVLSTASSLYGTHRSSQSSTSCTDYSQSFESDKDGSSHADWRRGSESQDSCVSSDSQTVMTLDKSFVGPLNRSTTELIRLPSLQHEPNESISRLFVPRRSSSISAVSIPCVATSIRAASAKPCMADVKPRRLQSRASYSLFPPSAPPPSIPMARLSRLPTIVQ